MTRLVCAFIAALTGLAFPAAPAQAQLPRTFVFAAGENDANDCSRAAPCRTFQGAHDRTIDAGEIIVLNAGHYGPVLITKSISILNDSAGEASISVGGGVAAIIINAPATGAVHLRGITIVGNVFGGGSGVRFNAGQALTMENCTIRRRHNPAATAPAAGNGAPSVIVSR